MFVGGEYGEGGLRIEMDPVLDVRVSEVKRLVLRPGDRVVYETDRLVSPREVDVITRWLRLRFPDHEVLVVGGGSLAVVTPEDGA